MIHCSWEPDASMSATMWGRATLRIVLSIEITVSDRHRTASVHQRRSCIACSSTYVSLFAAYLHWTSICPVTCRPLRLTCVGSGRGCERDHVGDTQPGADQGPHP